MTKKLIVRRTTGAALIGWAVVLAVAACLTVLGTAPAAAQPLVQNNYLTAIQSAYSGEWVSAETGYTGSDKGMLRARSPAIGPLEKYRFEYNGNGNWGIYSFAAQAYVSTEITFSGARNGMLRARHGLIQTSERFNIIYNADGTYSLRSVANGRYVSVEFGYTGSNHKMLRARATSIGSSEKFYLNQSVRSDGRKPVLFIHGYSDQGRSNCPGVWGDAVNYYDNTGWALADLRTVKYYTNDVGCTFDGTLTLGADFNTNITELGRRLAWSIFYEYSRFGVSVDVIAHSMGGLITRAAVTGIHNPRPGYGSWPPYLYVEDVSTLGTPYQGYSICAPGSVQQCIDMAPSSPFLTWLAAHPNPSASGVGPDWTLIASGDDGFPCCVTSGSALNTGATAHAGHKILYLSGQSLDHGDLPHATSGSWNQRHCHYYDPCNMANTGTWPLTNGGDAPIEVAAAGNYYWYLK